MTCSPAPIVNRFGDDMDRHFGIPYIYNKPGPGGVFLGSVGDQSHHGHASSHNCQPNPQESPVDGVSYAPNYAHAYDCRPINHTVGMQIVRALLADPRVRYINYDNVRYYPDGSIDDPIDHPTFHVSFLPGTHNDTRPFFTEGDDLPMGAVEDINNHTDERTDPPAQRKRDRNRAKGTARVVRQTAVVVKEIAEAVGTDKRIDAQTLRQLETLTDQLALIVAEDDKEGEDQ